VPVGPPPNSTASSIPSVSITATRLSGLALSCRSASLPWILKSLPLRPACQLAPKGARDRRAIARRNTTTRLLASCCVNCRSPGLPGRIAYSGLGREMPAGVPPYVFHHPLSRGLRWRFFQGGLGLHSFVTATKPQPSLIHNLKSVPLVLTADSSALRSVSAPRKRQAPCQPVQDWGRTAPRPRAAYGKTGNFYGHKILIPFDVVRVDDRKLAP